MLLLKQIKDKHTEFQKICRLHGVKKLYAFGSGVESRFEPLKSDFDFLVEMIPEDPLEKGDLLISLWSALESFFDRKIDLITPESLKNPWLKESIQKTRVILYDGEDQKVVV